MEKRFEVTLLADALDFVGLIESKKISTVSREHLKVVRAKVEFVLATLNRQTMRTEAEVRARRSLFMDALAETYGMVPPKPFNEERIKARIEEDEWFLNDKGEK